MAKAGANQRLTCPACGTQGSFRAEDAKVCKVCGTRLPDGRAAPPLPAPAGSPAPPPAQPRGEPPTALAAISLACGILAFTTLWVQPISFLLILGALACGIAALARHEGDAGVQVMAGIGVGLGAFALILIWFVCVALGACNGGSSWEFSSSGDTDNGGGSSNDGGQQQGGSGGQGEGSGGEGGGSGGGGGETEGGSSGGEGAEEGGSGASDSGGGLGDAAGGGTADSPMPVALLSGIGLLAAAAWRRRE